jgi:chaperonin GroES
MTDGYVENEEMEEVAQLSPIETLLQFAASENIAFDLDEDTLEEIGMDAEDDYKADNGSRTDLEANWKKWLDTATQVKEEKSYPWEDAANVKYPLLGEAAFQFNARAFPAIIPGKQIVKATVTGKDADGEKMERAERVADHMSYQLTDEIAGWEESMDRALLVLPVVGCFFKKTYWDVRKNRPESKVVWAQDLVVNNDFENVDIEDVPVISEPFELFPKAIMDKMRTGQWLDVELSYDEKEEEDVDYGQSEEFVEQHREIDLDGDGYPEPYIVTFHVDSTKVVKIVPRYDEDNIMVLRRGELVSVGQIFREWEEMNRAIDLSNQQSMAMQEDIARTGQVVPAFVPQDPIPAPDVSGWQVATIKGDCLYTKYYFLPSPSGSFYEMGLGEITQSIGETIDTSINQMLDASTLANIQGGFKEKAAKVPAGVKRIKAGEWVDVECSGGTLQDSFLPFNFRGPTPAGFNLLSFLLDAGKGLTSVQDIMTGESNPNETATTTMIKREEGAQVFNAVYKRVYRSFKRELSKIYRLNAKYLQEKTYFNILDNERAVAKQDYTIDETDIQPVADPTVSSLGQRLGQAEALMQFVGDPDFDARTIKRNYLEAAQVTNIDAFMPPVDPNAPPSPQMVIQFEAMQEELNKLKAEVVEKRTKAVLNIATAEEKGAKVELETISALKEQTDDQGRVGGVESQPANPKSAEGGS